MKKSISSKIIAVLISFMLLGCWTPVMAEEKIESEGEAEVIEEISAESETEMIFEKGTRFNPYNLYEDIEFKAYESENGYPWINVKLNFNEISLFEDEENICIQAKVATDSASTDDEAINFDFFLDIFSPNLEELSTARISLNVDLFSYLSGTLDFEIPFSEVSEAVFSEALNGYLRFSYFASEEDIKNDTASYFWMRLPDKFK